MIVYLEILTMEITKIEREFLDSRMKEVKKLLMKSHSILFELSSYLNSFVVRE